LFIKILVRKSVRSVSGCLEEAAGGLRVINKRREVKKPNIFSSTVHGPYFHGLGSH
jgi:hypothetical protein